MSGLERSVERVLRAVVPPAPLPSTGELLTFVSEFRSACDSGSDDAATGATAQAAYVWALLRLGRSQELAAAADFGQLMHRVDVDPHCSLQDKAVALGAVAESALLAGHVLLAAEAARYAAQYAEAAECKDEWRYVRSLLAAALALNGQFVSANALVPNMVEALAEPLTGEPRLWPGYLAGLLLETRRSGPELASIDPGVDAVYPDDFLLRGLAMYRSAVLCIMRGDFLGVLELCESKRHGLDYQHIPRLFQDLLLGVESLAAVQQSQPAKVLTLLEGKQSPANHMVCFELLRASAYLQLGDPQAAVDGTAACVKLGERHSLGTFPSMLLRRAIAFEQLGESQLADVAYTRSSHIAMQEAAIVPPVGVPVDVISALFARMAQAEPEFAQAILNRDFTAWRSFDAPVLECRCSDLSKRELALAEQLAAGWALRDIAEREFVSINTIKTQVRSIYRKLGCSSRDEAVGIMQRAGFFS